MIACRICHSSPSSLNLGGTKLAEVMLEMHYYISLHQKNAEAVPQHSSQKIVSSFMLSYNNPESQRYRVWTLPSGTTVEP